MSHLISHHLFVSALAHEEDGARAYLNIEERAMPLVSVPSDLPEAAPLADSAAEWMSRHDAQVIHPAGDQE